MRLKSFPAVCLAAGLALGLVLGCTQSDSNPIVGNSERAHAIHESLVKGGDNGSSDEAVSSAKPTGWASLSGTIKLDGTARQNPILQITKDSSVCQPGGAPVHAEQVITGPDGGLANVIIFVRKVPESWVHEDAKKAPEEPLVFDQKNCVFLTHVVGVHADRKILIKNSDPVGHNTNIKGFDNPLLSAGGTYDFSFNGKSKSVPIPIACSIHPWMRSYMLPLKNGYFAVTGKDGKFEIKNLPAGVPLEFQVWQEAVGGLEGGAISNPNIQWKKKGRFVVTLKPDTSEVLDIDVPASVFN